MKQLIENFSLQLAEAMSIGKAVQFKLSHSNFNQVLVSGLGGSGIGASIVQEYVYDKLKIPFVVNKDYFIPKSVNANTLFIACSYSGNTEETLQAVALAKKAKAQIVCITSGGELFKLAKKNNYPVYEIPSGMPPRACLGYSLVQLLFILKRTKLLSDDFESSIQGSITLINKERKSIQKKAGELAKKLVHKQVAIYSIARRESLGIRFRQQLNENSKVIAWSNVIPEMTHNEIVGWRAENKNIAIVYCYDADDYPKNLKRLRVLKNVIKKYNSNGMDIVTKGNNYWEKAFYFIYLTDWISVYIADANGNDASEVKVIDYLKAEMSKK